MPLTRQQRRETMTDQEIRQKFLEIIADVLQVDIEKLTPETRFNEDLDILSMNKFVLVSEIEDLTDTEVTYQQFNKNCRTVGEALDFVAKLNVQ